jgi:glycyl-tRNA synthetase beta chain
VTQSVALYGEKLRVAPDELASDVMSFFEDRLENLLTEAGVSYDAALAALAVTTSPRDAEPRARAIDAFRASPDFERLTIGFKRVSNILKGVERVDRLDAARLAEDAERQLHAAVEKAAREIATPLAAHDYESVMRLLLGLRPAIDAFFDKVLVMTDDATVRANRLALLAEVRSLFLRFADLSRIVIEGEKR